MSRWPLRVRLTVVFAAASAAVLAAVGTILYLSIESMLNEQIAEHPATRPRRDRRPGRGARVTAGAAAHRRADRAAAGRVRRLPARRGGAAPGRVDAARGGGDLLGDVPAAAARPGARATRSSRLGETLNEMLERLDEGLLARERRFVADAGHELRTPLALLRTELELALRGQRSQEELKAALRSATEEVERLIRLSEGLLVLERSGGAELRLEELEARELLDAVARRFASRAAAAGAHDRVSTAAARSAAIATGSSRRSAASSTTRSRTARGRYGSTPSRTATRSSSASTMKAPASGRLRAPGVRALQRRRQRHARAAAPVSGSRSSTP